MQRQLAICLLVAGAVFCRLGTAEEAIPDAVAESACRDLAEALRAAHAKVYYVESEQRGSSLWFRVDIGRVTAKTVGVLGRYPIVRLLIDSGSLDLASVRTWPVEYLGLMDMTVTNWPAVADLPLRDVVLSNINVDDLAPLARIATLRGVCVGGMRMMSLAPLAALPLKYLNVAGCGINGLSPLRGMPLTYLNIAGCGIDDISPVRGMPLRRLGLCSNPISNLEPLAGMRLEELTITDTRVQDISVLRGMPLEKLRYNTGSISNGLDVLAGMKVEFQTSRVTILVRGTNDAGVSCGGDPGKQDAAAQNGRL